MNITYQKARKQLKKFQLGGPIDDGTEVPQELAPVEEAPTEGGEEGGQEDPMMQLALIFAQGLQNQDCQALAQGAQMFLQLLQQSQGGGEQQPEGQPVFKKGGRLAYRIKN